MSKEAERIEHARRAYVAAMGTPRETAKRAVLEWLVQMAKERNTP